MFDRTRLAAAREAAGLTMAALADRAGLSISTVYGYETGRRTPQADQLGALANALGVSADYLLGMVDAETDRLLQRIERDHELAAALAVVVSHR